MTDHPRFLERWKSRATETVDAIKDYFGSRPNRSKAPLRTADDLRNFLETRASFVAQTSLYGYLRTRAGMIYPQLFDDDEFVKSINRAKWHVWLACLSDLSVYVGGQLARHDRESAVAAGPWVTSLAIGILDRTGIPDDADTDFAQHADRVRARLAGCRWNEVPDDETAFSQSPTALVRWAPIVEHLKELDEEIVRNSVRFRWQEVRRDVREFLDAPAMLRSMTDRPRS